VADANRDRDAVISDIETHLAQRGPQEWALVRARWPDVPEATWWRWVALAKRKIADAAILEGSRRKLAERAAATTAEEKAEIVGANLPVAPSPDFLAKNGDQGVASLDLLAKFQELYDDSMLLRGYAVNAEGNVKNPMIFRDSVALRDRLLQTALRAAEAVWNLRRQIEFYDLVVDEVAKASPEVAQAIMERLSVLNERTGMAFNARP
jgi:hypothetical protein